MADLQYDEDGMLIVPNSKAAAPAQGEGESSPQSQGPAGQSSQEEEDDHSLGRKVVDGAVDVGRGVVSGVARGAEETLETVQWAAEGAGNAITGGNDLYVTEDWKPMWLTEEEVRQRDDVPEWQTRDLLGDGGTIDIPDGPETKTVAGGMAEGVSQFVTAYATFGRQLGVGKGLVKATTGGAVADFVAFDEHEDRFADFLRDNLALEDPITEYLQADENDSVVEGKLKNAIEGAGMGLAVDAVTGLVRGFRRAKRVQAEQGDDAAAEVMNETVRDLADDGTLEVADDVADEAADPAAVRTDNADPEVRIVGDKSADEAPDPPADAPLREEPKEPMDVEAFQEQINREIGLVRGGSMPDPNREVTGRLFNFNTMDSEVSVKEYMNMAADAIPEDAINDTTTFAKIGDEARRFLADSVDVDPDVIDGSLAKMAGDAKRQQGIVVAGKMMVQSLGREVEELAQKISQGMGTDVDYSRMVRLQSRLMETSANLKSVIQGAAQTTSAGRIRTSDVVSGEDIAQSDILKQMQEGLDAAGGKDAINDLANEIVARRAAGNGGPGNVMRVVANRKAEGFWQVANEIRINGLLSGPKTHMINMISNSMNSAILPAEKFLGGAMKGDSARAMEGLRQVQGMAMAFQDSVKAMGVAFKRGRNILDPEAAILEANGSDFRAIRSESKNPIVRNLINGLGTVIRLPSRGLLAGDEFFKQINYRSSMYARLHGEASRLVESGRISKKEAASWIDDRMRSGTGKEGQATSLTDLNHAREATFTQELRRGSAPRNVQDFTNKHPWAKLVMPFVRTPTNIVLASVQRTPLLRRASKSFMEDLRSTDPSRRAAAEGKRASGAIMWGSAIFAASQGHITGNGPTDRVARQRLIDSGWRPYSIRVPQSDGGVKYVEYNRLEPFSMFFGIAADLAEMGGQMSEEQREEVGSAAMAAFINNVGSKTWLQGLTDAVGVLSNPDMNAENYLQNMTASFLPYSSAMREMRKQGDPAMRDVQSVLDAVKNTIPGYSEELPARRSWVTGEPIIYPHGYGGDDLSSVGEAIAASANPILEGEWKGNMVLDELANLEFGFSAPSRKVMGVEMTPEQYETYLELHGKVRPPSTRRTMQQELERLFNSPSYDLNRERTGDVSDPELNPRVKAVKRVISGYRKLAREELLMRYPEMRQKVIQRGEEAETNAQSLLSGVTSLGE